MDRVDVVFHSTFRVKLFIADQTSVFTGLKVAPRAESQMSFESRHTRVGATAALVGALDFPLQLHLILPLPQHLLAEGREAGSGIFQLLVIWYQVGLKLPLGPVFGQFIVGNLSQVEVGHLGRGSLHPAAGRPLWISLPLSLQCLIFLSLLWCRSML